MFNYYWETLQSFLVSLLLEALKRFGPIPQHVAIIMDGNRRFAKKHRMGHVSEGHLEGAKTLERVGCRGEVEVCIHQCSSNNNNASFFVAAQLWIQIGCQDGYRVCI